MSLDASPRGTAGQLLQPNWTSPESFVSCERESLTVAGSTTAVLFLAGEIDMFTHLSVHDALSEVCGRATANSIVDLTGVRFCSISGFSMLLDTARAIETEGRHFAIVARSPQLTRAWALLWPDHRVPRHTTIAGAMAEVRARGTVARRHG